MTSRGPVGATAAFRTATWLVVAALVAAACGGASDDRSTDRGAAEAGGGGAPLEPAAPRVEAGAPVPLESALAVTGTAELDPAVRIVELAQVQAMGEDGTHLTLGAGSPLLEVGALFVVPGVASGRVTSVEQTGSGAVRIDFEQPTVQELFEELDVAFSGRPDPGLVLWETDEATGSDAGSTVEVQDLPELADVEDPDGVTTGTGVSATGRPQVRLARLGAADPDGSDAGDQGGQEAGDDGQEGNDGDGPVDPCAPADEADTEKRVAKGGAQEFTVKSGFYTVTVRHRLDGACGTHYFKVTINRAESISMTASAFGWVSSREVDGRLVLEGDDIRQTVDLDLTGEMWFSMSGQVKRRDQLQPSGVKIPYDNVKKDIPIVVAGVPFLIRFGVPISLEVRFPSVGDVLTATLVHFTCDGRINTSGEGVPESTCVAAPATPHISESFALMSFIVAVGFKAGFGPGVSIPLTRTTRNTMYAGATAVLSTSTGVVRSGTATAPLIDCTRLDRSVQFNLGVEAEVVGLKATGVTNVWKKSATDHWGRQCPVSEMAN